MEKHAGEALEGRQEKTGHTESFLRVARRGHMEQGRVKIESDGGFSHWASKGAQADEMSYIFVLLPPKPQMDRVDTNTLAVVNQREEFVGVITQDEIVRKVLTKVMREA